MATDFLYAQAPNRKGNYSTRPAKHFGVPSGSGLLSTPAGSQGMQKVKDAMGNNNQAERKQPVLLYKPKGYDGACHNDGYMNSDRKNYLK